MSLTLQQTPVVSMTTHLIYVCFSHDVFNTVFAGDKTGFKLNYMLNNCEVHLLPDKFFASGYGKCRYG